MMFGKYTLLLLAANAALWTATDGFVAPNNNVVVTRPSDAAFLLTNKHAFVSSSRLFSDVAEETASEAEETTAPEATEEEAPVAPVAEESTPVAEEAAPVAEEAVPETEEAAPAEVSAPAEEPYSIYVGNLSFDTTEAELCEMFESHGQVSKVTIPTDRNTGRSRGFAFVEMTEEGDAEKAIEAFNGEMFDGRTLRVNKSVPKDQLPKREARKPREDVDGTKIYVGNISFDTTKDSLIEYYSQFGSVKDIYVPMNRESGMPRGFAFITMSEEDAAKAIESTDGVEFEGRTLAVSISLPRGEKAPRPPQVQKTKLYVGNLSFYTTVDELRSLFEQFGEVTDCYMPQDRETGRARGFAFVTMDPEDAQRATEETDGYEMDGRILRVNEAQPKGYSSSFGGGGDDGGYYDDGAVDGDSWGDDSGDDSWGNDSY